MPSGYEDTAWDYVDRAVCAAMQGEHQEARQWLEAARERVSFLRIRELVNIFLDRLNLIDNRLDDLLTAVTVFDGIDPHLVML